MLAATVSSHPSSSSSSSSHPAPRWPPAPIPTQPGSLVPLHWAPSGTPPAPLLPCGTPGNLLGSHISRLVFFPPLLSVLPWFWVRGDHGTGGTHIPPFLFLFFFLKKQFQNAHYGPLFTMCNYVFNRFIHLKKAPHHKIQSVLMFKGKKRKIP